VSLANALLGALLVLLLPGTAPAAEPPELVVSVGGAAENPAYLPVHAAVALGTFEAEGVRVTLRRAKHPTAAMEALRDKVAAVAVTTADQAVRGGWARKTPVRVVVAHTQAPAVALMVPGKDARGPRPESFRDRRIGIPGPGTTGHLVLLTLLRARRVEPWQLELVSLGGPGLLTRLRSGTLDGAVVEELWVTRALETGSGAVWLDFRRPADALAHLGGPFYEVVSVTLAEAKAPEEGKAAKAKTPEEKAAEEQAREKRGAALAAYARALIRVQAWLATAPAAAIAERLPAEFARDRERFLARFAPLQGAYVADGEATEAGLAATLRVLRAGSPWPVDLEVTPERLREPPAVTAARRALGPAPPEP
jgi:ABC-type nitrate/sulfonate/bicarbonate transport system substrate-binding protein